MEQIFGTNLGILENAGLKTLGSELENTAVPFDYLHILAHGYRDEHTGGVCLTNPGGGYDPVMAQALAAAVYGHGLNLVFLCSCQTGVAGDMAFSGVGQHLLAREGGDLPCVVATQANLPVRGSAELAERFYRVLAETRDPAVALARARRDAFDVGDMAWSVPILLDRPRRSAQGPVPVRQRGTGCLSGN